MMTTRRRIDERPDQAGLAHQLLEEYAGGMPLDHRERLRLCLLIEEALGMICGIMDGAEGTIWMDGWGGETRIHIDVSAKPNPIQREALASVASNGRNEGGRSFMQTLGAFITDSRNHVRDRLGSILNRGVTENDAGSEWSLKAYRNHLDDQSDETHAALQELERSIVAHLADDVIVRMRNGQISLLIVRHFRRSIHR